MSETVMREAVHGQVMLRAEIPILPVSDWRRQIVAGVRDGLRVTALFGQPDGGSLERVRLVAVLADGVNGRLLWSSTVVEGGGYPALTTDCPEVHWFEREIAEQWGLRPEGHPWLKPIRFHGSYRPGHDAWKRAPAEPIVVGVTDFFQVTGDEVHEVAVGPVHAGVIEPGHFRFQCHGERVMHLEISLGYQHRGAERALWGGPGPQTLPILETVAGDTTIGHALAGCEALEALAGTNVPPRALALRGIALELERLANHTGDLGALAGDVGYLPTMSYCGRLRGDFLNLSALLCGSRFGRGLVRPGGVGFDLDEKRAGLMRERLAQYSTDVAGAIGLLWGTPSVIARFENTGVVPAHTASGIGLVGPAARAVGLERDVRFEFPSGIYRYFHVPISCWDTGDVFARAYVRWLEIQRSIAFIDEQLRTLPPGPLRVPLGPLADERVVLSLIEGWRGEICHVVSTDATHRIAHWKLIDPSFHNWFGLAMSLRNQEISDFPLCNKSFNLSYCGHDL